MPTFTALDETTKTSVKVEALRSYFAEAPPADAAWAVYFLIGRKPRQVVATGRMRAWAAEAAGIDDWLFQESYDAVGDIAETIALLLPPPERSSDRPLSEWVEDHLLPLRGRGEDDQRAAMLDAWRELDDRQRFVWNKLISGGFRVGVSQQLVTRALGEAGGIDPAVVAHRLMGDWEPTPEFFARLMARDAADADISRPYPFFLAYALEQPLEDLGDRAEWQAEWKWDGIRSQLIRRGGRTFLWSRGEELVTERYPELAAVGDALPDGTAIDGEILPWSEGRVLPFAQLQRRIGRKAVTKAILAQVPVVIIAYDLLELGGEDIRGRPLDDRRAALAERVAALGAEFPAMAHRLQLSPIVEAAELGRAGARLGRQPRDAGRGPDAQAARLGLWRRPSTRRLVEVEGPAAHDRRRADRRPARQRQAREPLYRLHVRRLGQGERHPGLDRQGVLGPDRRRDPPGRRLRPPQHGREVRAGAAPSSRSWSSSWPSRA